REIVWPNADMEGYTYGDCKRYVGWISMELIINVVDTSDSAPFFNKKSFKAVVSEDSRVGSRLLQVKADVDGDSPLKYSLEVDSGPTDLLEIDDEGFIKNKDRLDFESYRKLEGRVIATDKDGNNASTNFTILLTDANDNRYCLLTLFLLITPPLTST
ncbi:hypothetical protein OSTOST_19704, partial [Ostertagia ostertagi]